MRNTRSKSRHGTKNDGLMLVANNNKTLTHPRGLDPTRIPPSIWAPDGSCLFSSMDPYYVGQRKRLAILIESVVLAVQENTFGELHTEIALSDLEDEELEVEPLPNEYTSRANCLIANQNISQSFKEDPKICLPTEASVAIQEDSIPTEEQVNRDHNEQSPTKLKGSKENVGNAEEGNLISSRIGQDFKIEADSDSEISIVFVGKGNSKAADNARVAKRTNPKFKNVSSILTTPGRLCTGSIARKKLSFPDPEVLKTIPPGIPAPNVLLNTTVVTIPIDIDNSAVRSDIKRSSSEALKSRNLKCKNPFVLLKRLKIPIDVLPVTLNSAVIPNNLTSILSVNIQTEQQQSTRFIAAEKNTVHQTPEASCTAEDKFTSPSLVTSKLIYVDPAPSSSIVNSKIEIQRRRVTSSSVKPKSKWFLQYSMTAEESKDTNDKKSTTETGRPKNRTPRIPVVMLRSLPVAAPAHVTSSKSVHSEFTDPAAERSKTSSPSSSISKEVAHRNHSCTTMLGATGIVFQEIASVEFPVRNKSSRSQSVSKQPTSKPIAAKLNFRSKSAGATGTCGPPYNYKYFEDCKSQMQLATLPDRPDLNDFVESWISASTQQTTDLTQFLSYEESPHASALSTSLSMAFSLKKNKNRASANASANDCEVKTTPEVSISKDSFWMRTKKVQKLSWWAVKVDDRLSQTTAGLPRMPLSTWNQDASRKRKLDSSHSVESKTYKLDKTSENNNSKTILCNTTASPSMLSKNRKEKQDKIFPKQTASISANTKLSMWQGGKNNRIRWNV